MGIVSAVINKTNNPVPDDEPLLFSPLSHERFDVPKSRMMKGMNKVMKEVTFFESSGSTFIHSVLLAGSS